ncbi:hypothetical protein GH5_01618 [Leishmania sp. Ghana 2012 LV757]|uniref:hypothetical protein n=1 Tax=Leishmania sp. Ghana 2012 LV757 TaxID=2803181 RepID=UPI001B459341|nr:hypothetical protein GH5_01618 [Leishmania sp. Ghana 2012 LV757]
MFYTYAEKQGNVFFDGWQMRQIAFDTLRRHFYYSSCVSPEKIAYPNANDNPLPTVGASDGSEDWEDATPSLGTTFDNPAVSQLIMRPPVTPLSQQRHFNNAPPPPNNPDDVQWRKKIKVDMIVPVGKEHAFMLNDTHLKEMDLFQVEIHGEVRPMASGETPSPGPLLCPSAGLSGLPDRCTVENDEFIRDPFFLRELYEALRYQFSNLRMERERAELASGHSVASTTARRTQTLESPRTKNGTVYRGSRIKIVLRMRTDYEFRRFSYVVQTVLGYDKLTARPFRGLPPYDPRNGLIFAMIPMCVWHTFKLLDKTVFYSFLRGDVVGRNANGELHVTLRGAYLCITHDSVLVMRDTGNIPRWIKLQEVREFYYNVTSSRPFVAFLSDPGAPDIIFIPQPPIFGPDAIRRFSPSLEVLRLRHVIHETCFASLEIRRVIDIDIAEVSVRSFVERYERETQRNLDLDPARGYAGVLSCPLPKEQLAQVWREVQGIYATRDPNVISRAAIPLYQNNTNDTALTRDQLETLSRRLARERASRDDIVGLSYEEAQRIQAPARRNSRLRNRHPLAPPHQGETASAQSTGEVTSTHPNPSPNLHPTISQRDETLPAASGHLRSSHTATLADLGRTHDQSGAGHEASFLDVAAGSPLDSSGSPTRTPPMAPMVPSAVPLTTSSSVAAATTNAAETAPHSCDAAGSSLAGVVAPSSGGGDTFTHANAGRTTLPSYRLETPQLSSSVGGGAAGFGPSSPMGASPGMMTSSFASSQFGGNSVQYQMPGARYLSVDEVADAGYSVAVDHHTILSETPLHTEGSVEAFLTMTELNVSDIVNRSISAMQATTQPPKKRPSSAGLWEETCRGSGGKSVSASISPSTARCERSSSQRMISGDSSVET